VMFGEDADTLARTGWAQPAIFAFEVALFRLLESWGVRPDAVAGHSIGEIAAAHVAGVLSLEDACRLVAARARLMDALPEGGAMVAVEATEEEVTAELTDGVAIAAVNGPQSVVVSGEAVAVRALAARFEARGRRVRELQVSHAFHSPLMEPMLAEFGETANTLTHAEPTIPLVSTVTGQAAEIGSGAYWVRQVCQPVRFADAVRTLKDRGIGRFVEVGPDAVLTPVVEGCLPAVRRSRPEVESLLAVVAQVEPDWKAFYAGTGARRVDLPTYAFQHRRYWLASTLVGGGSTGAGQEQAELGAAAASAAAELQREIAGAAEADRERLLLQLVRAHVAAALGHAGGEEIEPDLPFQELGFDSVTAVAFRDALGEAVGLRLPATLVFDHPTSRAVAAYLHGALAPAGADGTVSLLAEVDRLEAALAALAADAEPEDQVKVTARLEALLRRWDDARTGQEDADSAAAYDDATDDELFEALDSQLGI